MAPAPRPGLVVARTARLAKAITGGNLTTSGSDKIYHVSGGQYHDRTIPEECFAAEADARAAGYRRSQR